MKTFRGWLVIIFSMFGLHSLAEELDPVSDEADMIEIFDQVSPESIELLKNEIGIQKALGRDTIQLEIKLQILEAKPTENTGIGPGKSNR